MLAIGLVDSLVNADTIQVPGIVQRISNYRRWADPLLHKQLEEAPDGSVEKLHAALAILPVDAVPVAYLWDHLLVAPAHAVPGDTGRVTSTRETYRSSVVGTGRDEGAADLRR